MNGFLINREGQVVDESGEVIKPDKNGKYRLEIDKDPIKRFCVSRSNQKCEKCGSEHIHMIRNNPDSFEETYCASCNRDSWCSIK